MSVVICLISRSVKEVLSLPIFVPPFFLEEKHPLFEWEQPLWR